MPTISRRSFVLGSSVASGLALAAPHTLMAAPVTPGQSSTLDAAADPEPYKFSLGGATDSPIPGGLVHRANKAGFPILRGVAAFSLQLDPHAMRQPHLHTNANEISYIAIGHARVGLVGPGGEQHVFELNAGELAFQPAGWVHWLENLGNDSMFALFMYSHEQPETIDVSDVIPALPKQGY